MFSQYSWWDLTKIVLVALVIYYAYVLWTYYREDIREWLSNRGQKPDLQPQGVDGVEEEEDSDSLYTVSQYRPSDQTTPAVVEPTVGPAPVPEATVAPTEPASSQPSAKSAVDPAPVPSPALPAQTSQQTARPDSASTVNTPSDSSELNLNGPVVAEENPAESDFALTMSGEVERPQEESLTALVNAAGRVQADNEGKLMADNPADKEAQRVADVINQQQGRAALAGFAFNR